MKKTTLAVAVAASALVLPSAIFAAEPTATATADAAFGPAFQAEFAKADFAAAFGPAFAAEFAKADFAAAFGEAFEADFAEAFAAAMRGAEAANQAAPTAE